MIGHLDGHDRRSGDATYTKYKHVERHTTDEFWMHIEGTVATANDEGVVMSTNHTFEVLDGWWDHDLQTYRTNLDGTFVPNT